MKASLVLALIALAIPSAQAAPDLHWAFRYASAEIGANGSVFQSTTLDQNDHGVDAGMLNAQAVNQDIFAMAFGHLENSIAGSANGGIHVAINAFGDIAAQNLPPYGSAYSFVDVYFQLDIHTDQAYRYALGTTLYPASGISGITQYDHFVAFNDPNGDSLLDADTTYTLYGRISYRLAESGGVYQAGYPGTTATLTLNPVPEPETWAMLLAGIGLVSLRLVRAPVNRIDF